MLILLFIFILFTLQDSVANNSRENIDLADRYFETSQYLLALDFYRKAFRANPYDIDAMKGMGRAFYRLKNYDKALFYFNKARKQFNFDAEVFILIAKVKVDQGYFSDAESFILKALSISPRNYQAYISYGDIFYRQKNYDKSLEFYFKASKVNPDNTLAYLKLGKVYLDKDKFADAFEFFEKAQSIDNHDPVSYLYLGEYFFMKSDFTQSEKYLQRVLWLDSQHAKAMNILYRVYFQLGRFDDSRKILLDLINNVVSSKNYLYHLALLYFKLDMPHDAVKILYKLIEKYPNDEIFRLLLERIFNNYYLKDTKINSHGDILANYWHEKGNYYYNQNMLVNALFSFLRATHIAPKSFKHKMSVSNIYRERGFLNLAYKQISVLDDLGKQSLRYNKMFLKRMTKGSLINRINLKTNMDSYVYYRKPSIAILAFNENHDFDNHYGVEKLFRGLLFSSLRIKNRFSVFLLDKQKNNYADEMLAKARGADFIIRGFVKENDNVLSSQISIFSLKYLNHYKTIDVTRKGNDRFLESALYLASGLDSVLPSVGQIISRKDYNKYIVNVGKLHGFKEGDLLYVIKHKAILDSLLSLSNLDEIVKDNGKLSEILSLYSQSNNAIIEQMKIIELGESLSVAILITDDVLNEVDRYDYVIKKP